MAVCPINFDEIVECPFVDRKEFIEAFENAFQNISQKNYSILVYYGVAGIGKTSLRKELPVLLEKHNESDRHRRVIWTSIDFATEQYRQPYKFLEVLSSQLRQEYGIKFNSFDIALATYWKKINPHVPLVKANYSEDSIVRDVLDICDEFVPANLIPNVLNLARDLPERYQKWSLKRKKEISRLPNLEPADIDELLPVYWAYDLADHLQNCSESAVIFIDTYEALWEKERDKGSFNDRDKWLRKLVENIQKSCMWVICGREALRWEEVDEDWNNHLNQRKIGKLPEKDAINLLEQCGITEKDIQKVLIKSSEGVPYYLELSIDTYRKIKKKKQPAPEDFAKVPDGIFCRFVKYLDREEKATLIVLSGPRYWDRELFETLVDKFKTEYPATCFSELHGFSFITVDDKGKCSMHQLMRKSLQEYQERQNPSIQKKVHIFMFKYYSEKLREIDIKQITNENEKALIEAFYHGKVIFENKELELFNWYKEKVEIFFKAGLWKFILPLHYEVLKMLETKLGKGHPEFRNCLINLAQLHHRVGQYKEAKELYERSLKLFEHDVSVDKKELSITLNNLAVLYKDMGMYREALNNYERALELHKEVFGANHSSIAITLNNTGELYRIIGEYEKALEVHQCALQMRIKNLGVDHPSVAISFNNMALVYINKREYEKALPLLKSALEITKKNLGPNHYNIASYLNNLGEVYHHLGRYEEALNAYQRAEEICEDVLSSNDISFAKIFNSMASTYQDIGEHKKSIELYQRSLNILESNFGNIHPYFATTLSNMASVYQDEEKFEKALSFLQQAINIYKLTLESEHPDIANSYVGLALIYLKMGKYHDALNPFKTALEIYKKAFGPNHVEVATILKNLAGVYEMMGKYDDALPLYENALAIFEKNILNDFYIIETANDIERIHQKLIDEERSINNV